MVHRATPVCDWTRPKATPLGHEATPTAAQIGDVRAELLSLMAVKPAAQFGQLLSLGQAARLTGTSKTTLTRAIKAGRLSAHRRDGGGYAIDPSELSRVYQVTPETPGTRDRTGDVVRHVTSRGDDLMGWFTEAL